MSARCCSTVFAGLATVFGLMLLETPILWPIDVGGVFINLLLLGYALPAVLALLLSYAVAGRRPASYANTIAAGALVLALDLCHVRNSQALSRPGADQRRRPPAPSNTPIRSRGWRSAWSCSASASCSIRSAPGSLPPP